MMGEQYGEKALADTVVEGVRSTRNSTVTIDSVDDTNANVIIGGGNVPIPVPLSFLNIENVSLKIKPAVGSLAVIQFADGIETRPYFVAFSRIDSLTFKRGKTEFTWNITPPALDENGEEIEGETEDVLTLAVGDSTLNVNNDAWVFNGGELGGFAIVEKLAEKYNALKTAFDSLKANYNTHIHASTSGTISPTTSQETTVIQTVNVEDIQNDKMLH